MATAWIMVRLRFAALPAGTNWRRFYGVAILTGIGFTMSLFIATLAFGDATPMLDAQIRGAVLLASIASAIAGFCVLRTALPRGD
jgi:Na+:H+ antiporter, NhaA family